MDDITRKFVVHEDRNTWEVGKIRVTGLSLEDTTLGSLRISYFVPKSAIFIICDITNFVQSWIAIRWTDS